MTYVIKTRALEENAESQREMPGDRKRPGSQSTHPKPFTMGYTQNFFTAITKIDVPNTHPGFDLA